MIFKPDQEKHSNQNYNGINRSVEFGSATPKKCPRSAKVTIPTAAVLRTLPADGLTSGTTVAILSALRDGSAKPSAEPLHPFPQRGCAPFSLNQEPQTACLFLLGKHMQTLVPWIRGGQDHSRGSWKEGASLRSTTPQR